MITTAKAIGGPAALNMPSSVKPIAVAAAAMVSMEAMRMPDTLCPATPRASATGNPRRLPS